MIDKKCKYCKVEESCADCIKEHNLARDAYNKFVAEAMGKPCAFCSFILTLADEGRVVNTFSLKEGDKYYHGECYDKETNR